MAKLTPNDNIYSKKVSKEQDGGKEQPISEVIRSEVNLLTFPYFALWDKDVKKRTETEYRTVITKNAQKLEIAWIVVASPRYGYPGPFDREVYKAIEQILNELPLPIQNPIPMGSLYNLCKRIGIKKYGGSQYKKIKESLKRITATSIESKGTYYSKEKKEWIEDIFHLYERVIFKGAKLPDGTIAEENYIFLNSWYLDNINARYVKPIDWLYYKSLKTPISQRLYDLLGVKFYGILGRGNNCICYKYSTLCDLLPIVRQKYMSKAKQILDPAHIELKEKGFLSNCDWEEIPQKENDWYIRYYPGKKAKSEIRRFKMGEQLELPLSSESVTNVDDSDILTIENNTIAQLTQRGITKAVANTLFSNFPIDQIQKQIEIFDCLVENKSPLVAKNPAGFLRRSIEENYHPPAEYNKKQEREILEQKRTQEIAEKEAEQARLDDIQRQVDKYRDGLNDEERQLLRQEAVEFIDGDKSIKKAFVTEHLIRVKENDIIRERLKLE